MELKHLLGFVAALVWLLWVMPLLGSSFFGKGFTRHEFVEFTTHVLGLIGMFSVMAGGVFVGCSILSAIAG